MNIRHMTFREFVSYKARDITEHICVECSLEEYCYYLFDLFNRTMFLAHGFSCSHEWNNKFFWKDKKLL